MEFLLNIIQSWPLILFSTPGEQAQIFTSTILPIIVAESTSKFTPQTSYTGGRGGGEGGLMRTLCEIFVLLRRSKIILHWEEGSQ